MAKQSLRLLGLLQPKVNEREPGLVGGQTLGCMLKRKGDNVVDSLHWDGQRIARKSFTDDESDTTEGITNVSLSLLKDFLLKGRKLERLEIILG